MLYRVAVRRDLIAQHFLEVPGPEGAVHSHSYVVELEFAGEELDDKGFLVDLDLMTEALVGTLERLRDNVLNELPAFRERLPSAENLARTIWEMIVPLLGTPAAMEATVTVWESGEARASYQREIGR